jgi:hypothetical protein
VKIALGRVALALLAALTLAGVAMAATQSLSVTITSPKSGSSVSLKSTPHLTIAGTAAFAPATAATTTMYLRRDGCGTANDNPRLSVTSGKDGGDGCGLIVNSVVGLGGDVDQASFVDFPARNGMPLAFDGTRSITGVIALTGGQVGLAEVDVDVSAIAGGQAVDLGSTTASAVLNPTGANTPVPFTIPANASLNGLDIAALDLRVHVHGPNVYSGYMALSGASYAKVPSYTASVNRSVSVSIDGRAATPARVAGTKWTVTVPTPSVGKHTIQARASQGYTSSGAAQSSVTVTK